MSPIDLVLARLEPYHLRQNGNDRWRACCPAHAGSNPSALSVGIGDDDVVLLRCWSGCDIEQIVSALGLELVDLFPAHERTHSPPLRRRRLLTGSQALDLLTFESEVVVLAALNLANGHALTPADLDRLRVAAQRIDELRAEAKA